MKHVTLQMILTSWQTGPNALTLYLVVIAWAAAYVMAAARPSARGRRWPRTRTTRFLTGLGLLVFAYGSGMQTYEDNPTVHVLQHMLVMMAVPPLLVFAAPLTLLLRTLPLRARRAVVRELKDPAFKPLSGRWAPIVLCVDYYLTMYVYQLTPLHSLAEQHPLVHFAVHQYFLICGLLFWLPIASVDPVRFRPTSRVKHLMIATGLPAFAILGGIEIANGSSATGLAYIVVGAVLTAAGLALVAAREGGRLPIRQMTARTAYYPPAARGI